MNKSKSKSKDELYAEDTRNGHKGICHVESKSNFVMDGNHLVMTSPTWSVTLQSEGLTYQPSIDFDSVESAEAYGERLLNAIFEFWGALEE